MIAARQRAEGTASATAPVRVALVSAGEVYGGVERFVSTFSRHLMETRAGVPYVILFSEGRLAEELRAARVPVAVSPRGGRYNPLAIRWVASVLRDEMIDVVHAHGYKGAIVGGLAARLARVPAVKTEHGAIEPFTGLAAVKMKLNLAVDGFVTSRFFQESVYITEDLRSHKGIGGRRGARVIPNGVPPMDGAGRRAERANGEFRVGIVGRLAPVKGHDVLFEALGLCQAKDRLRIEVFGSGPMERELRAKAEKLPAGSVRFHGFRDDVLEAMAALDCLAMPSRNEGLPYTLLEAMHLGLPIVASSVGGMRENLSHGRTALLFEAGDAPALAAHLDSLASDPRLGERLGAAARADARQRFDIDSMEKAYLKLYREVM